MKNRILTSKQMDAYEKNMRREERSDATVEKYLRNVRAFAVWLDGRPVTQEIFIDWKNYLTDQSCYAPSTVNTALAALNGLFRFLGWRELHARYLKIQRRAFRDVKREMGRREYDRLVAAARKQGKDKTALLMETICATGIRVSEVQYLTVETVRQGKASISLKGKHREILLPEKLGKKLMKYAAKQKIASGEIFLTESGKPMERRQIWREMKGLCACAGVDSTKVFPHNLRHLFAVTYYKAYKDIVKLADVLGHSSIETTRIYLLTSGKEHRRHLDMLGLVL